MPDRRTLLGLLLALCGLSGAALADAPLWPAGATTGGPVAPDGTPAQVVLPPALHMKNVGGSDGAGLCVFTSVQMAGRLQNVAELEGFQDWMRRRPGGGYPSKLDSMMKQFFASKSLPVPPYVQVESRDLDILRLATKTGRMPAVTTGYLPGYRGRIAHMTNLAHASEGGQWAILDNNFPGRWAWLSEAEFLRSYTSHGNGWAVILLSPGPPPAPKE